jgi:HAE1 family hydrophobic/amphiphilic exporter-1
MVLAVSGERGLLELKEFCEELLKPRLEQVEGIGSADIAGGVEREIQVELNPHLLSLYGLSVESVSTRMDAFNRSFQGGSVYKGRFKYALRISDEFESRTGSGNWPAENAATSTKSVQRLSSHRPGIRMGK